MLAQRDEHCSRMTGSPAAFVSGQRETNETIWLVGSRWLLIGLLDRLSEGLSVGDHLEHADDEHEDRARQHEEEEDDTLG